MTSPKTPVLPPTDWDKVLKGFETRLSAPAPKTQLYPEGEVIIGGSSQHYIELPPCEAFKGNLEDLLKKFKDSAEKEGPAATDTGPAITARGPKEPGNR